MAATYKDIRRVTGLSLATISKYFNGGHVLATNRALIEAAVRELGFQVNDVARGLRSRRSMTVGVVLAELNSTFNTSIVSRMDARLREAGYGTIICDARQDPDAEAEALRFLAGKQVDAVALVPVGDQVAGLAALRERVPVVAIDRLVSGSDVDAVVIDNQAAITSAVELLAEAGHRDIALLAGSDQTYTMRERRIGFRSAVQRTTGAPAREDFLLADDASVEGGHHGLRRLLALPQPPTAVVCANYEFTLGATIARNELDADQQPAFVGFDNQDLARVIRPRPTLVTQPVEELADQAAELLLERMGTGRGAARRIVLGTQLQVGDPSTYALPGRSR